MRRVYGKKKQSVYGSIYLSLFHYEFLKRLQKETSLSFSFLLRSMMDFIYEKGLTEEFKKFLQDREIDFRNVVEEERKV